VVAIDDAVVADSVVVSAWDTVVSAAVLPVVLVPDDSEVSEASVGGIVVTSTGMVDPVLVGGDGGVGDCESEVEESAAEVVASDPAVVGCDSAAVVTDGSAVDSDCCSVALVPLAVLATSVVDGLAASVLSFGADDCESAVVADAAVVSAAVVSAAVVSAAVVTAVVSPAVVSPAVVSAAVVSAAVGDGVGPSVVCREVSTDGAVISL
jgi:hypothetical protein